MRGIVCCRWIIGLAAIIALSGCYQTPQQKLIGRWYNPEMSLRFEDDGSVVFNSSAGLARGRYQFLPTGPSSPGGPGGENLVLDVVRNGQKSRLVFEATFLAHDRLKLVDRTPRAATRPSESVRQFALLRRAQDAAVQASVER